MFVCLYVCPLCTRKRLNRFAPYCTRPMSNFFRAFRRKNHVDPSCPSYETKKLHFGRSKMAAGNGTYVVQ